MLSWLFPKQISALNKEMLMANSIQVDAVSQLLIEKGIITEEEFYNKLKEVQMEYGKIKG